MSSIPTSSEMPAEQQNRRAMPRQRLRELVYIDLGQSNGGMLLNISEDGINFQGIQPVSKDQALEIEFMLPGIGVPIEATGEITWLDDTGKCGGLKFVNLSGPARRHISHWLSLCALTGGSQEMAAVQPRAADAISVESASALRIVARHTPAPSESQLAKDSPSQELALASTPRAMTAATQPSDPRRKAPLAERGLPSEAEQTLAVETSRTRPGARKAARADVPARVSEQAAAARSARTTPLTFIVAAGCFVLLAVVAVLIFLNTDMNRTKPPASDAAQAAPVAAAPARQSVATAPAQSFQIEVVESNNKRWALGEGRDPASAAREKPAAPRSLASAPAPQTKKSVPAPQRWTPPALRPLPPTRRTNAADNIAIPNQPAPNISAGPSLPGGLTDPRGILPKPPDAGQQAPARPPANQPAELIKKVDPAYSPQARQMHLEGVVQVSALIGRDGVPRNIKLVKGDALLGQLAVNAIREWRYRPAILNGGPVEQPILVSVTFHAR